MHVNFHFGGWQTEPWKMLRNGHKYISPGVTVLVSTKCWNEVVARLIHLRSWMDIFSCSDWKCYLIVELSFVHCCMNSAVGLGTHLFIKVPLPGDSEVTSSSQAATFYYQFNHLKVEEIPLSALPKDTTSELVGLSSHYPFFMLKVKQGSCEYQLLKSFGLTRPGNRTLVHRLRRSNH